MVTVKLYCWQSFYRVMHYSAKRGIAIACRLSVCLSVWKSWKLIARTLSPTSSLFAAQRPSIYSHGNAEQTGWGVEMCVLEQKSGNIFLKCVKNSQVLWRAYRTLPTLFWTVPSRPPRASSSPRLEVRNPYPKLQSLLSQELVKLRTSNLAGTFTQSIRNKTH